MRTALVTGLRTALRRAPLVILLWQVNLVFGAVFAALGAFALGTTLGASWQTRSLLYDLDLTVFFGLLAHEAPTLTLLGASAASLALVYVVAWFGLHGAIVVAASRSEDGSLRGTLQDGARVAPAFSGLFCLSMGVTVLALGAVALVTRWVLARARDAAMEGLWEGACGAGVVIGVLLLVFCMAAHDHARIRHVTSGEGVWSSYAWALRFVGAGGRRAYLTAVVLQAIGVGVWSVYQGVAWFIATDWMTGVIAALVWGQLLMAARMLLRVWVFAAQARLQEAA